jgi:hypothetical protein
MIQSPLDLIEELRWHLHRTEALAGSVQVHDVVGMMMSEATVIVTTVEGRTFRVTVTEEGGAP